MNRARVRTRIVLAILATLVAGAVALCLGPETVRPSPGGPAMGPGDVARALTGGDVDPATKSIVLDVRLPRVLAGLLVGALLAVAGVLFQALLRNDLAEPYLVGIGPGAALGVTLAALVASTMDGAFPSPAVRGICAFAGAVGVWMLVFASARRAGRWSAAALLLHGMALGLLVQAFATGLLYVGLERWDIVMQWLLGHLVAADLPQVGGLAVVLALGLAVAVARARDLDALTLGEDAAWLVGVDVRRTFPLLGATGCLLAAAAIATSGLIGFVGLVVPHLGRRLVGAGHRGLVVACAFLGGGLLVLADALARILAPPLEIPPGLVTAALGAPVLLLLLRRAS
jgi:iron complex transport system permease protein